MCLFLLLKIILGNADTLRSLQIRFSPSVRNKRVIFINLLICFAWIFLALETICNSSMGKATFRNSAGLIAVAATTTMVS